MLISVLIIPLTMIGFGRLFFIKAPENINVVFGYRTAMSMKNKDTWEFAHRYFGRLWFRCGLILLPLSVIPVLLVFGRNTETVGSAGSIVVIVQLALLIGTIFPTEAALRKKFDKNGRRR